MLLSDRDRTRDLRSVPACRLMNREQGSPKELMRQFPFGEYEFDATGSLKVETISRRDGHDGPNKRK